MWLSHTEPAHGSYAGHKGHSPVASPFQRKMDKHTPKKPKRSRSRGILIRISDPEMENLSARAADAGLTPSGYVRALAFGGKRMPKMHHVPSIDRILAAELSAEMRRVGNNLNQIARKLNAGGVPVSVFQPLQKANQELLSALGKLREGITGDC